MIYGDGFQDWWNIWDEIGDISRSKFFSSFCFYAVVITITKLKQGEKWEAHSGTSQMKTFIVLAMSRYKWRLLHVCMSLVTHIGQNCEERGMYSVQPKR